jgi:hypothetical protein
MRAKLLANDGQTLAKACVYYRRPIYLGRPGTLLGDALR